MQNRPRFFHCVWLAVTISLIYTGATLSLGQPKTAQAAPTTPAVLAPMVLQGHVIDIGKDSITIRTPNIRPTPEPGKMTPMFIIAGETFRADISQAQFQSPMGQPNAHNDLKVGDPVIITCSRINMAYPGSSAHQPWPVTASVVEKIQVPIAP